MISRYKNRHNHPARNLLFFETEDEEPSEECEVLFNRHTYDEKAKAYYKALGTKGVAVNHEVRHTANTSSRDYSGAVDSWDIKDPKPPWEL